MGQPTLPILAVSSGMSDGAAWNTANMATYRHGRNLIRWHSGERPRATNALVA